MVSAGHPTPLELEAFVEFLHPHLLALCAPLASKQTLNESFIPTAVIYSPPPFLPASHFCLPSLEAWAKTDNLIHGADSKKWIHMSRSPCDLSAGVPLHKQSQIVLSVKSGFLGLNNTPVLSFSPKKIPPTGKGNSWWLIFSLHATLSLSRPVQLPHSSLWTDHMTLTDIHTLYTL